MTLFSVSHQPFALPKIANDSLTHQVPKQTSKDSFESKESILEAIQIYRTRRRRLTVTPETKEQKSHARPALRRLGKRRTLTPIKLSESAVIPKCEETAVQHDVVPKPVVIKLQQKLSQISKRKTKPRGQAKMRPVQKHDPEVQDLITASDSITRQIKEIRQQRLATQMLEIPVALETNRKRTMFNRVDYDIFQHEKFVVKQKQKKGLAIVQGPTSFDEDRWDHDRFLYLNVRL